MDASANVDDPLSGDELRAAAVLGIRWSSIARPITELIQLGSVVVLAHLIVPAEFGRYAVALIAQEVGYVLISGGVSSALIQRKSLNREHLQSGMALGLIGGLGLTALMLLAAIFVVGPIFGARTALFVELLAPLCVISGAGTVSTASLSRRMAFRRLSEIEVLSTFIRVAACVALAVAGLKGEALVLGTMIGALATLAMAWTSIRPPMPRLHRKAARELLDYGLPVSMAAIGWVGFSNVDYAIIGARLGPLSTGLYFRAYTLAVEYQSKISVVMTQVGFPVLSRTRSPSELTGMHRQMVRLLTILLFPLLVILAITAPELVPFLFGRPWTGAVLPVQILAVGGASSLVTDSVGTVLMATGRTRALLGFGMAHFFAYGLAVFLVVPLGIAAVAVAAVVVHTTFLVFAYALLLRETPENPLRRLWDDLAPATISCVGLAAVAVPVSFVVSSAHAPALVQLVAVGAFAVPAYLLTLRLGFPAVWLSQASILARVIPVRRPLRRRTAASPVSVPPAGEEASGLGLHPVEPVTADPSGVQTAA
jgi:O-antigen/teichoic acid export membrane protein